MMIHSFSLLLLLCSWVVVTTAALTTIPQEISRKIVVSDYLHAIKSYLNIGSIDESFSYLRSRVSSINENLPFDQNLPVNSRLLTAGGIKRHLQQQDTDTAENAAAPTDETTGGSGSAGVDSPAPGTGQQPAATPDQLAGDSGTSSSAGTGSNAEAPPAQSGSDTGTSPAQSGSDTGTSPAQSGSDTGIQSGNDAGSSSTVGGGSIPIDTGSSTGDADGYAPVNGEGSVDVPQSPYDTFGGRDPSADNTSSSIDVTMYGLVGVIILVMLIICCVFCRTGRSNARTSASSPDASKSKYSQLPTDENIATSNSGIELTSMEEGDATWEEWDSADEDKKTKSYSVPKNNPALSRPITKEDAALTMVRSSSQKSDGTSDSLPAMGSGSHHSRTGTLSGASSKSASPSTLPSPATGTLGFSVKPTTGSANISKSKQINRSKSPGNGSASKSRRSTNSQQNDVDLFASIGITAAPKFKEPVKTPPVSNGSRSGGSAVSTARGSAVSYKGDELEGTGSSKWNDDELDLSD